MANKNYLECGAVPKLSGDAQADIKKLHSFLCNMVGQAGYEIETIKGRLPQNEKKEE